MDTTGNIIVDIADGIGMMSKVKKNNMETLLKGQKGERILESIKKRGKKLKQKETNEMWREKRKYFKEN